MPEVYGNNTGWYQMYDYLQLMSQSLLWTCADRGAPKPLPQTVFSIQM